MNSSSIIKKKKKKKENNSEINEVKEKEIDINNSINKSSTSVLMKEETSKTKKSKKV